MRHESRLSIPFSLIVILIIAVQASPLPEPMASWTETTKQQQRDAGTAMIASLQSQIASGVSPILIPTGDYRFNQLITSSGAATHILLTGFEDTVIDFQGSTLWFENARSAFKFAGLKNCTIRNVTLDWDPLCYIQGVVKALDIPNQKVLIQLDAGYDEVPPEMQNGGKWRGCVFDAVTLEMKQGTRGYSLNFDWNNTDSNGWYIAGYSGFYGHNLSESGIAVSDPIAIFPRIGRAVRVENCDDNTLENFTLYASPFVGFAHNYGAGKAVYRNCRILRRPGTNRLMGGNADGINCANLNEGPLIEDCQIEYIGDDFVNVHTPYSRLVWQESSTSLISSKIGKPKTEIDGGTPVKMYLYDRATMTPLGDRMVIDVETITGWTIDESMCLADLDADPWHSGEAAKMRYDATIDVNRLILDAPITLTSDTICVFEGYMSAGAVIRRCDFVGSLARGLRLQSPEVTVQDNLIANTLGSGISLGGQPHYWGEGPFVHTAQIINNALIDTAISTSVNEMASLHIRQGGTYQDHHIQHDIVIAGNFISGSGTSAIIARGIDNLTIRDNAISDYMALAPVTLNSPLPTEIAGTGYGVVIESCDGVELAGNQISSSQPSAVGELFETLNTNIPSAPSGWNQNGNIGSGVSAIEIPNTSPFPLNSNSSAMDFSDTSSSYGSSGGVKWTWPAHASSELISVSFDLYVKNIANNNLAITAVLGNSAGNGGAFTKLWKDDGNGGHEMANQINSQDQLLGISSESETWYRIELIVQDITAGSDTYTICVTPENGATSIVADLPFRVNISDIATLSVINNSGHAASGGFTVSNVRIGGQPVANLANLNGWHEEGNHGTGVTVSDPTETSPFGWRSNHKIAFEDDSTAYGIGCGIYYGFDAIGGDQSFTVSFDYKVLDFATNNLQLSAGVANVSGNMGNFLELLRQSGSSYYLANKLNSGTTSIGFPLQRDEWYRIELTIHPLNTSSDSYDVTLTAPDGASFTALNLPFRFNIDSAGELRIWNNTNSTVKGAFLVDNVTVQP